MEEINVKVLADCNALYVGSSFMYFLICNLIENFLVTDPCLLYNL